MSESKPKRKRFERLTAFQYRDFRLLWTGEMISTVGSQMQLFIVNWHIYQLLQGQVIAWSFFGRDISLDAPAFGLAMIGLARVIPIVLFALIGGVLADAFDRRILMIWTRTAAAIIAAVLAYLTFTDHITENMIYLLTALGAAATVLDSPARQSIVPNLVNEEHLTNAISLNTLIFQIGSIVGPAVAGILVAKYNIGLVYAINVVTFIVAIVALFMIQHRGRTSASAGIGWNALVEGIKFTYNKRIIWGTMLLDFFATLFSSARFMLPIVAAEILHVGATGYGFLATAQPIGALIVGLILALRSDIQKQGIILLVSVAAYGLATALFGISTNFALSYILFAFTGAADTVSMVIRGTIRQLLTPDHLRGRMVSVNMVFFMGGPQLGELEAGLVGAVFGIPFAIFSGGVATILLTAWVAWKFPSIRRYTNEKEYLAATA